MGRTRAGAMKMDAKLTMARFPEDEVLEVLRRTADEHRQLGQERVDARQDSGAEFSFGYARGVERAIEILRRCYECGMDSHDTRDEQGVPGCPHCGVSWEVSR